MKQISTILILFFNVFLACNVRNIGKQEILKEKEINNQLRLAISFPEVWQLKDSIRQEPFLGQTLESLTFVGSQKANSLYISTSTLHFNEQAKGHSTITSNDISLDERLIDIKEKYIDSLRFTYYLVENLKNGEINGECTILSKHIKTNIKLVTSCSNRDSSLDLGYSIIRSLRYNENLVFVE